MWFKKRKDQQAADGTPIIRHTDIHKPQFGMPTDESVRFTQLREEAYEELFGDSDQVYHELIPSLPHIDVYQHPPGHSDRDFYTLVTGGMSDHLMTLPSDVPPDFGRVELIFYCSEPRTEYCELLRLMARFPHDNRTWFGQGHTIPNGQPPGPLFDNPLLDTVLFMPTVLSPDDSLAERLQLGQLPVNFLWVVPITSAECEFKLNHGFDALLDKFTENNHPFVFDPERGSYA